MRRRYSDKMELIADGVGQAFEAAFTNDKINKINKIVTKDGDNLDDNYVLEYGYYCEDDYSTRYDTVRKDITIKEMVIEVVLDYGNEDYNPLRTIKTEDNPLQTLIDLYKILLDYQDAHLHYLLPEKEADKYQAEKRRKELESTASEFAQKYNVKVDSFEFLDALHKELDQIRDQREEWNNPEARAERYAACAFNGTRDVFFEDNDYVSGQFEGQTGTIYDVLEWLESNCPLLMAKYREQQLETT